MIWLLGAGLTAAAAYVLLRWAFPLRFLRIRFDERRRGSEAERRTMLSLIKKHSLASLTLFPSEIHVSIHGSVLTGRLAEAYPETPKELLASMKARRGLPALDLDWKLSGSCKRVDFDVIKCRSGGMGSWFGYYGYRLETVVDCRAGRFVDCRGTQAVG